MKKSYVVSVKSPSDWQEIHELLLQDGTLEDNLPSRSCECVDEKPHCNNRATYLLDEDEAELLRNHSKVKYVGLDQNIYYESSPDLFPQPEKINTSTRSVRRVVYDNNVLWRNHKNTLVDGLDLSVSYFEGNTNKKRAVLFSVHGGGFLDGDKDEFDTLNSGDKKKYFNDRDLVYVSINYRLVKNQNLVDSQTIGSTVPLNFNSESWRNRDKIPVAVQDIAKALKWVRDNISIYGGDPNNIILFGHGAGATYAGILATNKEFIDAVGVPISCIKSCILLDHDGFDPESKIYNARNIRDRDVLLYMNAFGVRPDISRVDFSSDNAARQHYRRFSALYKTKYSAKRDIVQNFLIVARGQSSRISEAEAFKRNLDTLKISNRILKYPGTTTYDHEQIHSVLGGQFDPPRGNTLPVGLQGISTEIYKYIVSLNISITPEPAQPVNPDPDPTIPDPSAALINRFGTNVKNYRYLSSTIVPSTPAADDLNRTGWQLGRLESKSDAWASAYFYSQSVNSLVANPILNNPKYRSGDDGTGIDCVVTDDAVWLGHPEFVSVNGVSQVRDIILDGPYHIDPQYFIVNNLTTTFLGRTTCTESAAREWWRDPTKRSSVFIGIGSISVSDFYTRANICGSFSSLPNYDADHGTSVASLMYGKTLGWAFNSNKWSISGFASSSIGISIPAYLDAIRLWHIHKPKNSSGEKNPTIINSSWGYFDRVAEQFQTRYWWYYNFRGEYSYFYNKTTAPRFLKNFFSDNNSRYSRWLDPNGTSTGQIVDAGEDLVNTPGVVWVASAGNDNQKQVTPTDLDYNNWWSWTPNPSESQKRYVNRRGFPAQCGYVSSSNTYKVFSIGALDTFRFAVSGNGVGSERKANYSNAGPAIDILAPGEATLAASGSTSTDQYLRYDSQSYYGWLQRAAYDRYFNGTSASSPVFAGFIASLISRRSKWDWKRLKGYVKYVIDGFSSSELYAGPGNIISSNSFEWTDLHNLHGQEPKIIYNKQVPSLSISGNISDVSVSETEKVEFRVTPQVASAGTVSFYTYRWEVKKRGESTFSPVPGEIFPTITISNISYNDDGNIYRCLVDSDGPYDPAYSNEAKISVTPASITITSQPVSKSNITIGDTVSFTFTVNDIGNLTYQWEKKFAGSDEWIQLRNETSRTLSFKTTVSDENSEYRCFISWNRGILTTYTNVVNLDLADEILIAKQPSDTSLLTSQTLLLGVEASLFSKRTESILYQWEISKDSVKWLPVQGQEYPSLVIENVSLSDAGIYRCRMTSQVANNSPLYSRQASVIISKPRLTITSQPEPKQVIEDDAVIFSTNAQLPPGIVGQISYQWQYSLNRINWIDINYDQNIVLNNNNYILVDNEGPIEIDGENPPDVGDQVEYSFVITNSGVNGINLPALLSSFINFSLAPNFNLPQTLSPGRSILLRGSRQVSLEEITLGIVNNLSIIPGVLVWDEEILPSGNSKSMYFSSITALNAGWYRAKISCQEALEPTIYTGEALLNVSKKIVNIISDNISPRVINLGEKVRFFVNATFNGPTPFYRWEKKSAGEESTWEAIQNSKAFNYLELTPEITDHLSEYRCVVYNIAGAQDISNSASLTIRPAYQIFKNTNIREIFTREEDEFIVLDVDVFSTYQTPPQYKWQKFNFTQSEWIDIPSSDQDFVILQIEDLSAISKVRCEIKISDEITIYSNEVSLEENTLLNLFKARCEDKLTKEQEDSVDDIIFNPLIDKRECDRNVLNTCGLTIEELLDSYPLYDYQRGVFKSWGNIEFPWTITEATPNLIYSQTDDKWGISSYRAIIVYPQGTRVLLIEDDGYTIVLYEAKENILAISGAFDFSKWKKLCEIRTSIAAGIPTAQEVLDRFGEYYLEKFDRDWGTTSLKWNDALYEQTLSSCLSGDLNLIEFQKCINNGESDRWRDARTKRDFFYRKGDIFYVVGECGDTLCLYVVREDIPMTEEFYSEFKVFKESDYWQRVYCVSTGRNKCLEYSRKKTPSSGYEVIELGSKGHFVEMPIPYKLKPAEPALNLKAEIKPEPKILSKEEIDNLNQP